MVCHCVLQERIGVCRTVDYVQEFICTGLPPRKSICNFDYYGLIDIAIVVQVVFLEGSNFNLSHSDSRILVRCYTGEGQNPECFIQSHTGRTYNTTAPLGIMNELSCYEFWVIATVNGGTSYKFWYRMPYHLFNVLL